MSGVNLNSTALVEDYDEDSKPDSSLNSEWQASYFLESSKYRAWRRLDEDIFIEQTSNGEGDQDFLYEVKYREKPVEKPQTLPHGEINDPEDALEYTELIVDGKIEVEEILG